MLSLPAEVAVLALLLALLAVVARGYSRVTPVRRASFEGIDDPEAARAYDRVSRTPQFALLRLLFVRHLEKYHPAGTLVDVGCGPGYLIAKIAESVPTLHIIGVDVSDEMMTAASRNLASLGLGERVEFRKGDSSHLPFENDSLDNVVSTFSLHHWADPASAFREITRVLKPGGQFLLMDFRRDSRRLFYWLISFATRVAPSFLHTQALRKVNEPMGSLLASYTPTELESLIREAHFARESVKGGTALVYLWGQK